MYTVAKLSHEKIYDMCIICVQYNKNKDLKEAMEMVAAAGREKAIDLEHLMDVELTVNILDFLQNNKDKGISVPIIEENE